MISSLWSISLWLQFITPSHIHTSVKRGNKKSYISGIPFLSSLKILTCIILKSWSQVTWICFWTCFRPSGGAEAFWTFWSFLKLNFLKLCWHRLAKTKCAGVAMMCSKDLLLLETSVIILVSFKKSCLYGTVCLFAWPSQDISVPVQITTHT